MEITVEKIALIRESYNPKHINLNLDVDWSVEYTHIDQKNVKYDIVLKSTELFEFKFKLAGSIEFDESENFIHQDCSQIVFHHACNMLMNMISLSRQSNYELLNEDITSTVNAAF